MARVIPGRFVATYLIVAAREISKERKQRDNNVRLNNCKSK